MGRLRVEFPDDDEGSEIADFGLFEKGLDFFDGPFGAVGSDEAVMAEEEFEVPGHVVVVAAVEDADQGVESYDKVESDSRVLFAESAGLVHDAGGVGGEDAEVAAGPMEGEEHANAVSQVCAIDSFVDIPGAEQRGGTNDVIEFAGELHEPQMSERGRVERGGQYGDALPEYVAPVEAVDAGVIFLLERAKDGGDIVVHRPPPRE